MSDEMRIELALKTGNAAFDDPGEIARIFRDAGRTLESIQEAGWKFPEEGKNNSGYFNLYDVNGNMVGIVRCRPE